MDTLLFVIYIVQRTQFSNMLSTKLLLNNGKSVMGCFKFEVISYLTHNMKECKLCSFDVGKGKLRIVSREVK